MLPTTFRVEPPTEFPDHPRVTLNTEEIAALKAARPELPWLDEYIVTMLAECDEELAAGLPMPDANRTDCDEHGHRVAKFGLAYILTDDMKYANAVADILRGYLAVVDQYEITDMKGFATTAALSEGGWAVEVCSAYSWIYHSGALSEAELQAVADKLLRPSAEASRHCNHWFRSNWRNRAIAGFAAVGFCLGDYELIDEALNGYWEDGMCKRDGFVQQLAAAILADGVYYERSIGYHTAVIHNYALIMEVARHSGIDLWHLEVTGQELDAGADYLRRFGSTGVKTIKALYDMPFHYMFSNLSRAAVGNASSKKFEGDWAMEAAWRAYRDPKFAWVLHLKDEGRLTTPMDLAYIALDAPAGNFSLADDATLGLTGMTKEACSFFPNGGYGLLRQGTDPMGANVLMTFGKYGSGHSHPDKLAIVTCGRDFQMNPEVNYYGYSDDDFLTWNNQTLSHNTVTVDEISQAPQKDSPYPWIADTRAWPVRGEPLAFHAGDALKMMRAECTTAHKGVTLDRTVVMVDSTIIDFFRCRSDEEHKYDYVLHMDADLDECSLELSDPSDDPIGEGMGYEHMVNIRQAVIGDEPVRLVYDAATNEPWPLRYMFSAAGGGQLVIANGHHEKEETEIRRGMMMIRRKGKAADFVGVMQLVGGDEQKVTFLDDTPEGVLGIQVAEASGGKWMVLSAETSRTFDYAGYSISGQLALLHVGIYGGVDLGEVVP
jgi:hypothetical protein